MGKISNTSSYPFGTPAANDYVIGTDANSSNPDLQTKNYTLGDIAGLDPVDTLQEVLNAGNTATGSITLNGPAISTLLTIAGVSTFNGDIDINADIRDSVGSVGTLGQVLKSQGVGAGVLWGADSQPPLTATKLWYGSPTNVAVESTNILNDESGLGLLSLGQKLGGTTVIDNYLLARVLHPVGDNNLSYGILSLNDPGLVGGNNVGLGISALNSLQGGGLNTAVGYLAGTSILNSSKNTAMGNFALAALALDDNTAIGNQALENCQHQENTAVGSDCLTNNTIGRGNTAIGFRAGSNIIGGGDNVLAGRNCGLGITSQSNIIALGQDSVGAAIGDDSIGIGFTALDNAGIENIAIGTRAMTSTPLSFDHSIAIGFEAMAGGSDDCIAIGKNSMALVTGDDNIAIGRNALNTAGLGAISNIAIGTDCLQSGAILGNTNIALGFRVGMLGTFNNSIAIGTSADIGGNESIGLGQNAQITRDREFVLGPNIDNVNLGTSFSAQVAGGLKVFVDNTAAAAVLLPGDLYVVGPTGVGPVGVAAPIAVVY